MFNRHKLSGSALANSWGAAALLLLRGFRQSKISAHVSSEVISNGSGVSSNFNPELLFLPVRESLMGSTSHVGAVRAVVHGSFPYTLSGSSLKPREVGRQAMHDHTPS